MTISELVLFDAMLKKKYSDFMRHGHSQREAGFLFMEWLGTVRKMRLPPKLDSYNPDLQDLLVNNLLVCSSAKRSTCAEALDHKFVRVEHTDLSTHNSVPDLPDSNPRFHSRRLEDNSDAKFIDGRLWKLNTGGDPHDPKEWLKRDMWIANNGSLCYFSQKEERRLVLEDGHRMAHVIITPFTNCARDHAFQLQLEPEYAHDCNQDPDFHVFACDTDADYEKWTHALEKMKYATVFTMHLGPQMADDAKTFKLTVANRRLKVERNTSEDFEPLFQAPLWKLKSEGDPMNEDHWFSRDTWLSKNGSLVYFSKREEKELIYFASNDVAKVTLKVITTAKSVKPYTFEVRLPAVKGVEFAPAYFAAESEDLRAKWLEQFDMAKALLQQP